MRPFYQPRVNIKEDYTITGTSNPGESVPVRTFSSLFFRVRERIEIQSDQLRVSTRLNGRCWTDRTNCDDETMVFAAGWNSRDLEAND